MGNFDLFQPYEGFKVFGASVAFAAAICAIQTEASAQDLTIAVQKNPENHDPVSEATLVGLRVIPSLYDTLLKLDYRDGNTIKPSLAVAWQVIDAQTIEFKLRPGVVFHNGDTFDAEDVVATFSPVRIGEDKEVPVTSRQFLGGIKEVEVVDAMTVRIHMKEDDAVALNRFTGYPSQIISETALSSAATYDDFKIMDAGSGPYRLISRDVGDRIVLERFDAYWGDTKAAADRVSFVQVPELSTRIAGLLAGQFDIITEVGTDEFAQIKANPNTGIVGGPIENTRGLFFDTLGSPIADPRIREALNLAIDREAIVQGLYAGQTSVPRGWQLETFGKMYLADRPMPEFNIEKAKALLAEAGYDGEEIVYRTLPGYYTKQLETAQVLQSMWKAAGFNIKLEVKETFKQVLEDDAERAIIDASFTAYYSDPVGQFWRRFGTDSPYTRREFWTFTPEMLALGEELKTSIDTERRREVFGEMLDTFQKDPKGTALHALAQFMGVRSDRLTMDPIPSAMLDLTTDSVAFK